MYWNAKGLFFFSVLNGMARSCSHKTLILDIWWRHNMERFPHYWSYGRGGFPTQMASKVQLGVFFAVTLNRLSNKPSSCRWSDRTCRSSDVIVMTEWKIRYHWKYNGRSTEPVRINYWHRPHKTIYKNLSKTQFFAIVTHFISYLWHCCFCLRWDGWHFVKWTILNKNHIQRYPTMLLINQR